LTIAFEPPLGDGGMLMRQASLPTQKATRYFVPVEKICITSLQMTRVSLLSWPAALQVGTIYLQ